MTGYVYILITVVVQKYNLQFRVYKHFGCSLNVQTFLTRQKREIRKDVPYTGRVHSLYLPFLHISHQINTNIPYKGEIMGSQNHFEHPPRFTRNTSTEHFILKIKFKL